MTSGAVRGTNGKAATGFICLLVSNSAHTKGTDMVETGAKLICKL